MQQIRPRRGCLWPMWSHGDKPNHEYCGDHKTPGSSYCETHRKMSIRDFEEEPRQPFVPRRKAA
jgi:hypothetical protein